MKAVGIICEYNPFHLGHKKQLDTLRRELGEDTAIVCVMSGNFVQRGDCAILDKSLRAKAAVQCGADLVLELPVTYALSSAEGFAAGGVEILSQFCDSISFGTEHGNDETLMATAQALLCPEFAPALRQHLDRGISFPAARQAALADIGCDHRLLESPNDILAVEYCKAILTQNASMEILPITRHGNYHDTAPQKDDPSATAVRALMENRGNWQDFVPDAAAGIFQGGAIHSRKAGERVILTRLRTMNDEEFEALPYGSEGLWRKLMHASRECATLEDIITATKSKRYTRTRLDRMVMCAFLGITREQMCQPAPYARVLALGRQGMTLLKQARKSGFFPHVGDVTKDPYETLETRCDRLYGLFCEDSPELPNVKRRVFVKKEEMK